MTDRRPRARRFLTRALAGALLGIALAGTGVALAADHAVSISGFSYSPGSVTVAVGDTVTWTNSDAQAHTATADDASWDSGSIGNGASGTVTFSTAGTFPYHCSIHPEMTGTVTVQAAASGGGGGGGGGATTPPTDTSASAGSGSTDDGSSGAPAGWLAVVAVVAAAWIGGFAVARRRFVRAD